jgi:phosphonoacetate hydrolase
MITVNHRNYRVRSRPVVGICLDGSSREYTDAAINVMPSLQRIFKKGAEGMAHSVVPSFTNPNNIAIVTGTMPSANGISGNYYYDAESGQEVLMNDPKYLRVPTILAAFSEAGHRTAAITTKDKLRQFLSRGLKGICFSVECAHQATIAANGIDAVQELVGRANPGIYDPEASVYCLEAGARLIQKRGIEFLYLSTTDYVQHKYAPGSPEANQFYARVDRFIGELDDAGVILGFTADHGMNSKVKADGSPKVEFLETLLKRAGISEARVILPITDPYVVHHGALGSFATVYLQEQNIERAASMLLAVDGVELVLDRAEAAKRFSLPGEQIGELVVLADANTVLGRTPEWHDLSAVGSGLRSHGGLHESSVPMVFNRKLSADYAARLNSGEARNSDLFDFLCNGTQD